MDIANMVLYLASDKARFELMGHAHGVCVDAALKVARR